MLPSQLRQCRSYGGTFTTFLPLTSTLKKLRKEWRVVRLGYVNTSGGNKKFAVFFIVLIWSDGTPNKHPLCINYFIWAFHVVFPFKDEQIKRAYRHGKPLKVNYVDILHKNITAYPVGKMIMMMYMQI